MVIVIVIVIVIVVAVLVVVVVEQLTLKHIIYVWLFFPIHRVSQVMSPT